MSGWPVPQLRGRVAIREAEIDSLRDQLAGAVATIRELKAQVATWERRYDAWHDWRMYEAAHPPDHRGQS